ncbi:E3 ubiquitin-protein ligase Mdm2, partial [Orchesella cincta]
MDDNPSTAMTISSFGEKDEDSDATDYEPDPKKQKLEDTEEKSNNTSLISNGSDAATANDSLEKDANTDSGNIISNNASSDIEPRPVTRTTVRRGRRRRSRHLPFTLPRQVTQCGSVTSLVPRSGESVTERVTAPSIREEIPPISQPGQRRRTRRNRNRRRTRRHAKESDDDDDSNSSSSTTNGSRRTNIIADDMDPSEIPSDEILSPPLIVPPQHNRQRRNAIFERRDPPPSELLMNEDDRVFQDQLEIASVSDENPIEDENSTSGADDQPKPNVLHKDETTVEETDNNFADVETVRSEVDTENDDVLPSSPKPKELLSSDSELSDNDKWVCSQCKSKSMPYFRYCLKCFQMRRSWLPQRPLSRRLKRRKMAQRQSTSLNNSRNTRSSCVSECDDVVDGPIKPQPANSKSLSASLTGPPPDRASTNNDRDPTSGSSTPLSSQLMSAPLSQSQSGEFSQKSSSSSGGTGSLWSQSSSSMSQAMSQFSQNSQSSSATFSESPYMTPESMAESKDVNSNLKSLCGICCAREKDAAFVHNKIAHHFCCFTCADKILKQTGKCPICREKVFRVVKIISV